ncbi:hypothetical protein HYPBUDRAFT_152509 [Hyphopichia burtonii NRRL Y-1933]|uniref:Uncharacterized protein n=1 Tax=Hyphopichia burtonii NRRL Y-1933 TaxID=984485 RepID=A0A1E4RK52_9ASCO|nr:hypothetical protein HYPBUDRAFT_152509 [Hyphopichia burtonii NRRL Y-1933]ODV67657.1 hypothetical protein HYPBUDRAFT_152509 [Hyphopichia burtonii NRRL Y-1933]
MPCDPTLPCLASSSAESLTLEVLAPMSLSEKDIETISPDNRDWEEIPVIKLPSLTPSPEVKATTISPPIRISNSAGFAESTDAFTESLKSFKVTRTRSGSKSISPEGPLDTTISKPINPVPTSKNPILVEFTIHAPICVDLKHLYFEDHFEPNNVPHFEFLSMKEPLDILTTGGRERVFTVLVYCAKGQRPKKFIKLCPYTYTSVRIIGPLRHNSSKQNSGKQNSGKQNSGKQNSGKQNSEKQTSGKQTSAKQTSAKQNSGKQNSGKQTSGKQTSGKQNSGKQTFGKQTSGKQTFGKQTSGKQTSGKQNSIQQNSGKQNSRQQNSGKQNSGKQNSGKQNSRQPGEKAKATNLTPITAS